jgi:hypothetical protein
MGVGIRHATVKIYNLQEKEKKVFPPASMFFVENAYIYSNI